MLHHNLNITMNRDSGEGLHQGQYTPKKVTTQPLSSQTSTNRATKPRQTRDRSLENLSKRVKTLEKILTHLHDSFGADFYVWAYVPKIPRHYVLQSAEGVSPLLPSDMVRFQLTLVSRWLTPRRRKNTLHQSTV